MILEPGTRLGPFEIVSLLGTGGMGEVYRARDTRLDRTVAIKVLNDLVTDATGPTAIDRFRREALAIARISHPNICTLHDLGHEGSMTFLVMEYVEGATLARRLEDGRLPLRGVLDTAIQIADALDHAHRHGVIHRDLKPGNVMIAQNHVKLLDFGLAKIIQPEETIATAETQVAAVTERGTLLGTLPYMAPEQVEGGVVDARTDIFAFGIVLYEMLAGRRPFASDSRVSLMAAIVSQDPAPLSELAPLTSPSLQRLVARCLAKNPDDRWQTARDLAAELRWIAEGSSATDTKSPPVATGRQVRRFWLGALIGGTLAAIASAAASGMWPRATTIAHDPVTYRRGSVSAARFTPDGQNVVYSASWEGQPYNMYLGHERTADARSLELAGGRIMSVSRSGEMAAVFGPQDTTRTFGARTLARIPLAGGARRDVLDGIEEADWIPGTSDLAVVRIRQPDGMAVVEFPVGTAVHEARAAWSMRVSPDGRQVAFFEGPRRFDIANTGKVTVVSRSGTKSTLTEKWVGLGLAWAPSSQEIWFTGTRGLRTPSLHAVSLSGRERSVYAAPDWLVLHDISTDGRVLLTRNTIEIGLSCQGPGEIGERDLSWLFGSSVRDLSTDGRTVLFGELLGATVSGTPAVFRRSTAAGPAVQIGEGQPLALSPDGAWALVNNRGSFTLLPTGAGLARTLKKGESADLGQAGWLADGKQVVFEATEAGIVRGYVQDVEGGLPRPFTPAGVSIAPRALPPDGLSVLGRSGESWALYPLDGSSARSVPGLTRGDSPLRWSADGQWIYVMPGKAPPSIKADVFRVDVATGGRELWKTLAPRDVVGIEDVFSPVVTADGAAYCYSHLRRLGQLFVTRGLR